MWCIRIRWARAIRLVPTSTWHCNRGHFDRTEYCFPTRGYEVEYLTHLWGQPSLTFIAIAYRIRTSFGFHTTAIIPLTLNPSPWGRGTCKKGSGSPLPLGEGLGVRAKPRCWRVS